MGIEQWALVVAIAVLAALIQSGIGFGFSLVAVPLLLKTDLTMPETVALTIMASMVQRLMLVRSLRDEAHIRKNAPYMLAAIMGIPLGVWCLQLISGESKECIRQGVGALILLMIVVQYSIRIQPRAVVSRSWGMGACFLSGYLGGLANVGGPPLVLWILAHQWNTRRIRVTPAVISLSFVPLQCGLLWFFNGSSIILAMAIGLGLFPAMWLGHKGGLWIGNKFNVKILRFVIVGMLIGMSLWFITEPMF